MFGKSASTTLFHRAARSLIVTAVLASLNTPTVAEPSAAPVTVELTFREFMSEVAASNLDYAAQRYNVSIAEAQLAIAKLFLPNPTVQFGYGQDVTRGRPRDQQESKVKDGGFSQTIPIGGKRGARIDAARHS